MNNSQPWQKYPLIRKPLEEVNQLIQATIRTPYSDLQDALLEMASNGGKYLRPSLLILSAQIASKKETVSKQIIQLAFQSACFMNNRQSTITHRHHL